MTITDTVHTTDVKQPVHNQLKKSDSSLKLCAVSLINKFSSTLSKSEQQTQRRNSDTPNKFSIGDSSLSEKNSVKRRTSTTSITLNIDNTKKIEQQCCNSVDHEYNIIKLCEQPLTNKNISESGLQLMISPSEIPPTKLTRRVETTQPRKSSKRKTQSKNLPKLLISSTNLHHLNKTIDDDKKWYFQQKSISTPVSSSKNPAKYTQLAVSTNSHINNKNNSVHPYRNNRTNAIYNIQPMTPIRKTNSAEMTPSNENHSLGADNDDDDIIFTPSSCAADQWTSSDLATKSKTVKSATKRFMTRCRSSKSVDITPTRSPPQQFSTVNQRYYFVGPRSPTFDDLKLLSPTSKGNKLEKYNSLERSTTNKSSSSSSDSISSTSSSIFGKSEYRKKESKAISIWSSSVQRSMQKSLDLEFENKSYIKKYTEKDQAIARFVISELYSTEKSFYELLLFIRSNYMEPMYIASQSKNPLVKPNDVYSLFYCLPELISMSEKLLLRLDEYSKDATNISPGITIGNIFRDLEQDFAVFLKYAVHYQSHLKSIRRASHNGLILRIERDSKNAKENNRLGLADYLIAPFQRVPRYGLLIKDLIKHTEIPKAQFEGEAIISDLIYAQNVINGLATAMDRVQEKYSSKSPFSTSFYSSFHSRSSSNLLAIQQTY